MFDNILLLFLKAPVPGKVKTRLASTRGIEEAARLYKGMSAEVYRCVKELPGINMVVAYERAIEFPNLSWLDEKNPNFIDQEGESLGERLENAFRWAFTLGAKRVAALGGDSPGLSSEWIHKAFEGLHTHDLVLGPAEDGGYYLVGLQGRSDSGSNRLESVLFKDVPWSTPQVLKTTLEKSKEMGLRFSLLPVYFDVDDEETLKRWETQSHNLSKR
ncbi:MAG: TIGR04282 family arsenosugar biosynthesis glycosyltransferase [Elusimicrobia bacterium]|nr:TIGR04282 family arsenosugar biosynthesis glycosyltransferase [Elusimicrobiota bacterium]